MSYPRCKTFSSDFMNNCWKIDQFRIFLAALILAFLSLLQIDQGVIIPTGMEIFKTVLKKMNLINQNQQHLQFWLKSLKIRFLIFFKEWRNYDEIHFSALFLIDQNICWNFFQNLILLIFEFFHYSEFFNISRYNI